MVGLASEVDTPSKFVAYNLTAGEVGSVRQNGVNHTPNWMLIKDAEDHRTGADTIVFEKKTSIFGLFWSSPFYFAPDAFWDVFGGHVLELTWVSRA